MPSTSSSSEPAPDALGRQPVDLPGEPRRRPGGAASDDGPLVGRRGVRQQPDQALGRVAVRAPPRQLRPGVGQPGGEGVREPADDGALRSRRGAPGGVDGGGERGDGVPDDPPRDRVPAVRRGEHGRRELRERAGGVGVRDEQLARRRRERGRRARPVEGAQRGAQALLAEPGAAARVPEQQAVSVDPPLPAVARDAQRDRPGPDDEDHLARPPDVGERARVPAHDVGGDRHLARVRARPARRQEVGQLPGRPPMGQRAGDPDDEGPGRVRRVADRRPQRGGHRRRAPGVAEPRARPCRVPDVGRPRHAAHHPRPGAPEVDGDHGHGPTSAMPPGGVRSPGGMMSISIR